MVDEFTYLGYTISSKLSRDKEIYRRIGRAATSELVRLTTRVWKNKWLTIKTKVSVYNTCVLSTLFYGSEPCTTYVIQERRLNVFQMPSMRKLLGIFWTSRIPNTIVLFRCRLSTMFTMLRQRRLCWLRLSEEWKKEESPKMFCIESSLLVSAILGCHLRYQGVCKRDVKELNIDLDKWEELVMDRSKLLASHFKKWGKIITA